MAADKVIDLATAIQRFVPPGAHLSIGGFTINRNPMAAVHEIVRQRITDLHLYAHSNGQGADELIGGGCVSRIEIAYGGNGRYAPTCVRFRRAVEAGDLAVEDYSNFQMTLRFLAGAMGVPFLPLRATLGTDLVGKWGFSREARRADSRLPDQKLVVSDNPFGNWGEMEKVVLVPAICPDVTIIHVQKADRYGNARIDGLPFADIEQAKAARHLVITCETLVEPEWLRRDPDRNQIPGFIVDAVVPVAWGAYPTACFPHYDYDPVYLKAYREAAEDDDAHAAFIARHVYDLADHDALMAAVGPARRQAITADPVLGYAPELCR